MAESIVQSPVKAMERRIASVQDAISRAVAVSGRSADDITLVAVCKTVGRDMVDLAYSAGLRHFGENRVQDALRKFDKDVPDDLQLHMIGSLQTNKANQVVGNFSLIHSLDRVSLADALNKRAQNLGIQQPVLIQVNVAREEQKHGVLVDNLKQLVEHVAALDGLRLDGFMTMAPLVATPEEARPVFAQMREIARKMADDYPDLSIEALSMGMTNDFPVAIEEGATLVRVGRAIFQEPDNG
jgi:PLP dependent protein